MKLIYWINLDCSGETACLIQEHESNYIPSKDVKCFIVKNEENCYYDTIALYPYEITFDAKTQTAILYFRKHFWFWQENQYRKIIEFIIKEYPQTVKYRKY